jgi:hypothetical protein
MQLIGHKTRAVFERFNIVSTGDLRDAATGSTRTRPARLPDSSADPPTRKIRRRSAENNLCRRGSRFIRPRPSAHGGYNRRGGKRHTRSREEPLLHGSIPSLASAVLDDYANQAKSVEDAHYFSVCLRDQGGLTGPVEKEAPVGGDVVLPPLKFIRGRRARALRASCSRQSPGPRGRARRSRGPPP